MNPRSSKYKRFYDMNFNARRFRSSSSKEKFNGIMQTPSNGARHLVHDFMQKTVLQKA